MAAGVNLETVWLADYWQVQIQELQGNVERQLDTLPPTLRKQGFGGEEKIEAELKLSQAGVQVFFQKYRALANVAQAVANSR
jgi:hypothetical protein